MHVSQQVSLNQLNDDLERLEKEAAKVYADGGYVTNNPFVEDIFDN